MESRDVCIEGIQALVGVVKQIRDDQWNMQMPDDFPLTNPNAKQTTRDVVNTAVYDIVWIPMMLSGKTITEVGEDTFKGDLLGDDPQKSFVDIADTSIAAMQAHTDLDSMVHVSYAEYPAQLFQRYQYLLRSDRL